MLKTLRLRRDFNDFRVRCFLCFVFFSAVPCGTALKNTLGLWSDVLSASSARRHCEVDIFTRGGEALSQSDQCQYHGPSAIAPCPRVQVSLGGMFSEIHTLAEHDPD